MKYAEQRQTLLNNIKESLRSAAGKLTIVYWGQDGQDFASFSDIMTGDTFIFSRSEIEEV